VKDGRDRGGRIFLKKKRKRTQYREGNINYRQRCRAIASPNGKPSIRKDRDTKGKE